MEAFLLIPRLLHMLLQHDQSILFYSKSSPPFILLYEFVTILIQSKTTYFTILKQM